MRRAIARDAADAESRQNIARSIHAYARSTIDKRCRQQLPVKMPRGIPICDWLPGLSVAELTNIKLASDDDIEAHVFRGQLIPGVRAVQPLEEALLRFPPRVAPPEERERYAGGGGGPKKGGGPK